MRVRATRKLALAGAAASLGVGGAVAVQAPASADPCPSGALCAYVLTGLRGTPGDVYGDNTDLLRFTAFNNAASVFNNGAYCDVRIWDELNYTGNSVLLPRGTGYGNLAVDNPTFYRDIASNMWKCP